MKKALEEIQKLIDEDYPCDNTEQRIGYQYALNKVYNLLSLVELRKEEEPWVDIFKVLRDRKKQNVSKDLEKEIKTWIPAHIVGGDEAPWKELKDVVIQWAEVVARHFYILGLKNNIPVTQITLAELAKEGEPVSKDLEEGYKDKDWGILQDMSIGEEEE